MLLLLWLTRDTGIYTALHVLYRLLEEARYLAIGDCDTGNILIQGDNIDALIVELPHRQLRNIGYQFKGGRLSRLWFDKALLSLSKDSPRTA